jgi:hypothetical protein
MPCFGTGRSCASEIEEQITTLVRPQFRIVLVQLRLLTCRWASVPDELDEKLVGG